MKFAVFAVAALAVFAVAHAGQSEAEFTAEGRRMVLGADTESWSSMTTEQLMQQSVFGTSSCATIDIAGFNYAKGFAAFCKKYGKVYKANTYNLRFAAWKASTNCISYKNSNSANNQYYLRENHLHDHTNDEFLKSLGTREVDVLPGNKIVAQNYVATASPNPNIPASAGRGPSAAFAFAEMPANVLAPEQPQAAEEEESEDEAAFVEVEGDAFSGQSFDWRSKGKINPQIYYQRTCGNCWAFVVKTLAESAWVLAGNNMRAVSVQQITDCSPSPNNGCQGGVTGESIKYFADNNIGLCSETAYPFVGSQGSCKTGCTKVVQLNGYNRYYRPTDENQLFDLLKAGPVGIGLVASPNSFMSYGGGVYSDPSCNTVEKINHGMTLVGYGTDSKNGDYWILRNQWAASWGEQGYMRIKRGVNQCKIVTQWAQAQSGLASLFGIADGPAPGAQPSPVAPLSPCQTKPNAQGVVTRGTCQDVTSCTDNGGKPTAGLCPGPSSIQCCLNPAALSPTAPSTPSGASCTAMHPTRGVMAQGSCIDAGICNAAMNFPVRGACPGAANIQCCLQK